MKWGRAIAGAAIALGVLAAGAANAAILVATYTGAINIGYDSGGLFGPAGSSLTGDTYAAKFTIDTNQGAVLNNLPAYDELYGGLCCGFSSPIKVTLTIQGHTQAIAGSYYGFALTSPRSDLVEHYAEDDHVGVNNAPDRGYVNINGLGVSQPGFSTLVPLTTSFNFGDAEINTSSGYAFMVFQSLGTVQIAAGVPEPANWMVMLIGLGAVGGAVRSHRGRAARGLGLRRQCI